MLVFHQRIMKKNLQLNHIALYKVEKYIFSVNILISTAAAAPTDHEPKIMQAMY